MIVAMLFNKMQVSGGVFCRSYVEAVEASFASICHVMSRCCFALLAFDCYVIQHSRMNACLDVCNKLCVQHGRLASFAVA